MKKILDEIVQFKQQEVAKQKQEHSVLAFEKSKFFERSVLSLKNKIIQNKDISIIAEYKRQSPSKGLINGIAKVENVIKGYYENGAVGVSILTDNKYFGGKNDDLESVRHIQIPILRKEFIVDEYQIFEARAIGADCILLIAACLSKKEILTLSKQAKNLNLEILLELHEEKDLDCMNEYIDMIGINNRNLQNFEVDLNHSFYLLNKIPSSFIRIAESGIHNEKDLLKLKNEGFDAFLIGEIFMKKEDPALALQNFLQACRNK